MTSPEGKEVVSTGQRERRYVRGSVIPGEFALPKGRILASKLVVALRAIFESFVIHMAMLTPLASEVMPE